MQLDCCLVERNQSKVCKIIKLSLMKLHHWYLTLTLESERQEEKVCTQEEHRD